MLKHLNVISNNIITLIGIMGSGKTSLGKFISKKLAYGFYDVDQYIEKKYRLKIVDIFHNYGERDFRKKEKNTINELINKINKQNKPTVVSLGGGAFDNEDTQNFLLSNSLVVWLHCPIKRLVKRIGNDPNRPMLKGDPELNLHKLLEKRKQFYVRAHLHLDSSVNSLEQMTVKIKEHIYEN